MIGLEHQDPDGALPSPLLPLFLPPAQPDMGLILALYLSRVNKPPPPPSSSASLVLQGFGPRRLEPRDLSRSLYLVRALYRVGHAVPGQGYQACVLEGGKGE